VSLFERLSREFSIFYNSQKFGGITLIACTLFSLLVANSAWSETYLHFWHDELLQLPASWHAPTSPEKIVNDLLMAVFFLLVGMEIKREVLSGELSNFQRASLPLSAALGGMIAPALIYLSFNAGSSVVHGWGIPMATDIAFAIGILALLGSRVPTSLKILLTALAVADDLGAVLVIALFYTQQLHLLYLLGAAAVMLVLYLLGKTLVTSLWPYLLSGLILWIFIHLSGVHATIAGVLLALVIPYDQKRQNDPLQRLETALHLPVNHFIMPLFALANTAIAIQSDSISSLHSDSSIGIMVGLFLGKPIGILLFVWLSCKAGMSKLPVGITFRHILGIGFLGGIGFTMSIFIAMIAFNQPALTDSAKLAILTASTLSGIVGYLLLKKVFSISQQ
jgi:NhaA family Na+:H+ antiporter